MLLDGVVEGGLALDVLGVDLGSIAEEELAELDTLDAVDETGAAVVVWLLDVCVIIDQELDDVKVGHEAGGPHGGGASVGHGVDIGPVPHQHVDHLELAGHGGAPQRSHVMDRPANI